MQKKRLHNYARLIAVMGIHVQKGQEVFISAGLDQPEFVQILVEECYKAGAERVVVDWNYQPLAKTQIRYRSLRNLSRLDDWEEARWKHYVDKIPCRIYLESDDPDGSRGINQKKMAKARRATYPLIRKYRDQLENKYQWCIAAVPGEAWAKKLFPGLSKKQAVEKLWEAILSTSRVDDDPIAAWEAHNRDLEARCAFLNGLGIRSLHYRASNGTDFTVGMIPEAEFRGGGEWSLQNIFFNPNVPSEEVFISPRRGAAEGTVVASMPLSYQGELIENFSLRFEDGKVVEVRSEKNQALLEEMISMDEGAAYLGECALVPYDSPIRNSGILFYNTLFDENAACHLALGAGFADCLKDFQNYSLDEAHALGINESMIHVDFMIGTEDLDIDAVTADGKEIAVFRKGNWAF